MVNLLHYLTLINDRLDLLFTGQFIFAHDFHGVEATRVFLADENNTAESTTTDHLYLLEVVSSYLKLLVCQSILGKGQLRKVSPQKFIVVQST